MSTLPVIENAARRRIGDILLELGFASEEAIAEASAEQAKTGQPLGQILVQHGAITRLELASALAEQWSDQSASISLLPVPKPAPRPVVQHHEDDQYAARLQDAVADLARRVQATSTEEGEDHHDARVTDLAERLEATVARAQRIEATLATLAESLEGVTGGVEEAFAGLQAGMAGLAVDLARVDSTVAEIAAHPVEPPLPDPALTARMDELGAAVQALAERPPADSDARRAIEALSVQLEQLADGAALETVRESLGDIERRVEQLGTHDAVAAELESQQAILTELRSALSELQARPESSPDVDERLGRIEARLAEGLASVADAEAVKELAARIENAAAAQEGLAESVEDLAERLEQPSRLLAQLTERVEMLSAADRETQESLTARVEALEAPLPPASDPRIDDLVDEVAGLRAALSERAAVTSADLDPALGRELASLADRVEQLARDREAQAALAARVEALEVPPPALTADPRIDNLVDELAALRQDMTHRVAAATSELDPALGHELARLGERVEQLARENRDHSGLEAELEALEQRLRAGSVTPDDLGQALELAREELRQPVPEPDPRIDELVGDLAALRSELAVPASPPAPDPTVTAALDTVLARLETVEQRLTSDVATPAAVARAVDEVRSEVAAGAAALPAGDISGLEHAVEAVAQRVTGLESLVKRVDGLAETVAAVPAPVASISAEELHRELEVRMAELAKGLEATLEKELAERGAETARPTQPGGAEPEGFEGDMERMRMAIERLSLHLGEHDRALAETMRGRGIQHQIEELAARVDELAAGGSPAAGSAEGHASARRDYADASDIRSLVRRLEGLEVDAHEGREKLMDRLERIASTIDWRLQRLETVEPD